jgi:RHS repeat-associated protein
MRHDAEDRLDQMELMNVSGDGPRLYRYGYDPEGNLTSVEETLTLNNETRVRSCAKSYDERGRLASATDVHGRRVSYGYDAANNVTRVTDAESVQTLYSYDRLNRLGNVTTRGRTVEYGWTADGLIERVDYGNGMSRVYGYDNADRLTSIVNQTAGGSEEFGYGYDGEANRVSESRKRNGELVRTISYGYDELERVTSAGYEYKVGRGLKGEYFDNQDFTNLKQTRIDSTVDFVWPNEPAAGVDAESYSVRWSGKVEAQYTESYTIYAQSDEGVRVYVNGQLVIDAADPHTAREDSGTISLQAGQKADIRVEYYDVTGAAEMKLSWSSASQAKQVIPQSRLYPPDPSFSYSYDDVGNRLTQSGVGFDLRAVNRGFSYDELNRLMSETGDAAGTITFEYDANGNLKKQTQGSAITNYEYDGRDQLRRVSEGTSEVARFDYDYERRRLSKTRGGVGLSYVYDGERVINEYGSSGQMVNRYDWGADLLRGEIGGEGERLYFSDALGSTTTLGTSSGGVAASYEYDVWGQVVGSEQGSLNTVLYTGQRLDTETGLMPLGNGERYYSPSLAQFIQQDSFAGFLSIPQSLNRHSYVHDNPVKYTDPSGHLIPLILLIGAFAITATHLVTGTIKQHAIHNLEGEIKGWSQDDPRRGWGMAFSETVGAAQTYRGWTGIDPYTGEYAYEGKPGWYQWWDRIMGPLDVILNASIIGGALFRMMRGAYGLVRGGAEAFNALREGIREGVSLAPAAEDAVRAGRATWEAIRQPIQTGRAVGQAVREGYRDARAALRSLTEGGVRQTVSRVGGYVRENILPRFNPKNFRSLRSSYFFSMRACFR